MFRSFSFNLVSKRKYPRENQSEKKKKKKTTDLKPFSPPSNANKQSHNFLIFSSTESLGNTLPLPPPLLPSFMSSRLIHRGRGIFPLEARSLVRRQRKKERKKKKKKEGRASHPRRGMERDALWEDGKNGCGCCACTDIDRAGHATGCLSGYSSGSSPPRLDTRLRICVVGRERNLSTDLDSNNHLAKVKNRILMEYEYFFECISKYNLERYREGNGEM